MNGDAYQAEDFLPGANESNTAGSSKLPATAGTFSLRRSHYFNESKALLGLILSQAGAVLSFENTVHNHQRSADPMPYQHRRA